MPPSTSVTSRASCFAAARLPPRKYCVRYRFFPGVSRSAPSNTRSCQ